MNLKPVVSDSRELRFEPSPEMRRRKTLGAFLIIATFLMIIACAVSFIIFRYVDH